MELIKHGKVQEGRIVLTEPLDLPDGTKLVVRIEAVPEAKQPFPARKIEDFAGQPFFGMWADREDMKDSVVWVRKEREKWHQRSNRQD